MKTHLPKPRFLHLLACLLALAFRANAANVEAGLGYTSTFDTLPPASDWSSFSRTGGAADNYDMVLDVNTNISAANIVNALVSNANNPALQNAQASWSSTGQFIQTRATANRYTVLMGRFVNNTGTNATQLALSYQFTIAGAPFNEDANRGTKVFYSLRGATNTWVQLPTLGTTNSAAASSAMATNLPVAWSNGASLFLIWVDDNCSAGTDVANEIDNFSLQIAAGTPASIPVSSTVASPTNNALYVSGTPVTATAIARGTPPLSVEYFVSTGAGGTAFASAGTSTLTPYSVALGALPAGTYNIYAVVTDGSDVPAVGYSVTNTFTVADPLAFALTAPVEGQVFDNAAPVSATASVAGGSGPYSVQYSVDGSPAGAPSVTAPYAVDFGVLPVGQHSVGATVTDSRGWSSNAAPVTIQISGPLAVTLAPTNGASLSAGASLILGAAAVGGAPPYQVEFYVDGQLAGTATTPPFTYNAGPLPLGEHTAFARAIDSFATPRDAFSTTNIITVVPNPLTITLTNPVNGAIASASAPYTIGASANVGLPLTVTGVEFFLDGASLGIDATPPYSATIDTPVPGDHRVLAVALDSVGRRVASTTNLVTFVTNPLANDLFANRLPLSGAALATVGLSTGAATETGETTRVGNTFFGATLWWTWTAPASGPVRIDTFGSTFDTVLGVYTGAAVNALTQVAFNNNAPGVAGVSLVSFNAVQGTEYQIQVGGPFVGGGPGGFTIASGGIRLNLLMLPAVAVTSPTNGAVFFTGNSFMTTASASSPNGTIERVEFYRNGSLLGTVTEAPYAVLVANSAPGTNRLTAVAQDSGGIRATSAVVNVLVANQGVTILSPADGSVFPGPAPITVNALGLVPSGSVTNVTFFVDGQPLGSDPTAPFSLVWSNVTSGSHRISASAQDDRGITYFSTAVNVGVGSVLIPTNSLWKYLDNGTDPGAGWFSATFDDSGWTNGAAELGYGDNDEATVVQDNGTPGYTAGDTDRYAAVYFRHTFVVEDLTRLASLLVSVEYDDAVAIYLNGTEIYRTPNLSSNATYLTFATGAALEDTIDTINRPLTALVAGTNVIAVEVHQQSANSSDLSFNLQLVGIPTILRNKDPEVSISAPADNLTLLGPSTVPITATASDTDGTVTRVAFYVDDMLLGEDSDAPFQMDWTSPTVGRHVISAVATDDQFGVSRSAPVNITIFDAAGNPFTAITTPPNGTVTEGPTNMPVTASATALNDIVSVDFYANDSLIGSDTTSPYLVLWNAPFGPTALRSVVHDASGRSGTSAPVNVTITIPPTNVVAPFVAFQNPPAFTVVTNLPSLTVTFSERVQGVDAADLLINGVPATGVTAAPGGTNYTFTFPTQPYGEVEVAFANGHGITDFGYPAPLPFDELAPESAWEYDLVDRTGPTVIARIPAANTTVTNLTQIGVRFSEPVTGVDAGDLLVNGVPALSVAGGATNYLFEITQPASGTVAVSWSTNHGITDIAPELNPFNQTGPGATWNVILDARTVLLQTNTLWRFMKGTNEASFPSLAWRAPGFDDSGWSTGPSPFVYGEPSFTNALNPGTDVSDMASNAYNGLYLRKQFVIANLNSITNLYMSHQVDDGFVAWINGVEVIRYNMPAGEISYTNGALTAATESGFNAGVPPIAVLLTNAVALLHTGTNTIAVQAFNVVTAQPSSDFVFNAQLYTYLADTALAPPRVVSSVPARGETFHLTNLTVIFSEMVTNVDATDLLVNGVPASSVARTGDNSFQFAFPQPPYGSVVVTWAANHGIVDFDEVPHAFDGNAASSILRFTLINPSAPAVAGQIPAASTTVTGLTAITITFTEPVTGVDAADLLVNGNPATGLTVDAPDSYRFQFPQPVFGLVSIRWAAGHDIHDLETPANAFDRERPVNQWSYNLIDPVPTVVLTSPTNGAYVLAYTNVTLRATATDNDGTITRVEFFVDTEKVGEATNAPYTFVWPNVEPGTYLLHVTATDNQGITGVSLPSMVNVVTNLPVLLVRGPYLQSGSPTGAVVRWRTDQSTETLLRYGNSLAALTNEIHLPALTNEHIVRIGGLEPDTKYYYSIGTFNQTLAGGTNTGAADYWFLTSPPVGTRRPVRFWALGDPGTANASQRAVRDAYDAYAAATRPADLWLMLGDNAYNSGTDAEYQAAVFNMYPATLRNYFLWPTIGNHESAQSTTAASFPYLNIFTLPQDGEAGGVPSGNPKYYSFDYANIHFVCLDSMTSGRATNTTMLRWLEADLAGATAEWIIVFFHHPPYTKGSHNSDTESDLVEIRRNFLPILEGYGVDLVLSGHSHSYERSYLLHGHYGLSTTITPEMKLNPGDGRPEGDGAYVKNEFGQGVVYTVAGSSGQISGGTLNHPAMFASFNELGSLIVDVAGNRLEMSFLTGTGVIRDKVTLVKPEAPGAPAHLVAHSQGADGAALSWSEGSGNEAGFFVERSFDGLNYSRIATNGPNATTAVDAGLPLNTTAYYRVLAYNVMGESAPSGVASITAVNAVAAPAAPRDLVASAGEGANHYRSQILLHWRDRSANEGGFVIERSEDGSTFAAIGSVGANATVFIDRNLASATTYYYRVLGFNAAGDSAPSAPAGEQTHPQSTIVGAGEPVVFHAGVEGSAPIRYQWRFMESPIPGATNEMLRIPSARFANEGAYTVVITDADGTETSNPAWLFVLAAPEITGQPASRTNYTGSTATFRVTAEGTEPMRYAWLHNGSVIPGAFGPELVIHPVQTGDQGNYHAVVVNDFGGAVSETARLEVIRVAQLVIRRFPGSVALEISWDYPGVLQYSDSLGAGAVWHDIPEAVSPFTLASPTPAQRYFRVRHP